MGFSRTPIVPTSDGGVPYPGDTSDAEAFEAAVMLGEPEVVRSAIEHGVNVNRAGPSGTPPVVLAAAQGHEEALALLLSAGADPNAPDRDGGMKALHAAAAYGREGVVRKLLAGGADANAGYGRPPVSPLAVALRGGHHAVVRALLEAGARPDVAISAPADPPERQGITPLIYAASVGDLELLRMLVAHRANLDAAKRDGLTPLMTAAFNGQLEAVQVLVDAGANVNLVHSGRPDKPFTALDLAEARGHRAVADYLKQRNAHSARAGR